MTIEEKLENFRDISLKTATEISSRDLSDFKAELEKAFEEHQESAMRRRDQMIARETNECRIQSNKELVSEQLACRKKLSDAEEELTEELFAQVKERLCEFRKTAGYTAYLQNALAQIMEYGAGGEIAVEIDETDKHLVPDLAKLTGNKAVFNLVKEKIPGGLRAIIPGKNIMIDRSFEQRLEELHESFRLEMKLNQTDKR